MTETLFLQFYNEIKSAYFDLGNGFSDSHDLCKSKGDFFWTEHEVDSTKWYEEETYNNRELPIKKGTVYMSALYTNHLYQSYVWAKEYPEIKFIVGGPVAAERRVDGQAWNPVYVDIDRNWAIPPNLKITGKSVEDWFGISNFSEEWKLDVPENVPKKSPIYFSYTLDNRCYWSNCIYCNIGLHAKELFRERTDIHYEFKNLEHEGHKIVRINTASITPKHIREVLPNLPCRDDIEYRVFMRPAKAENEALLEVLSHWGDDIPKIMFGIGMEFPSDRMLRYTCKGFSSEEMLETLKICVTHGIRINVNFILGWNNLLEKDIEELKNFMKRMPEGSVANVQIRWLFAHPHTKIHDTYEGKPIKLGPFYLGFHAEVNEEQMALNKHAGEIISEYGRLKNFKVEGLGNIKND